MNHCTQIVLYHSAARHAKISNGRQGDMAERIGFISTRFAGSDGVSLESAKWAAVLHGYNHSIFWYAGRLDRPAEASMCVPEAFFAHPENEWIDHRGQLLPDSRPRRTPRMVDTFRRPAAHLRLGLGSRLVA